MASWPAAPWGELGSRGPWVAEKRDLGGALGLVTQGLIYTKLMAILLVRNGEDMKIGARFFLEPSHFVSSGLCRLGNFWRWNFWSGCKFEEHDRWRKLIGHGKIWSLWRSCWAAHCPPPLVNGEGPRRQGRIALVTWLCGFMSYLSFLSCSCWVKPSAVHASALQTGMPKNHQRLHDTAQVSPTNYRTETQQMGGVPGNWSICSFLDATNFLWNLPLNS